MMQSRASRILSSENQNLFTNAMGWVASNYSTYSVLNSNTQKFSTDKSDIPANYLNFDGIIACGEISRFIHPNNDFESLDVYISEKNDWIFAAVAYDFKNEIENLSSRGSDYLNFPLFYFYQPEIILRFLNGELEIRFPDTFNMGHCDKIIDEIQNFTNADQHVSIEKINKRISHADYLSAVESLQKSIQKGDIYEVNFCQEFFTEHFLSSPLTLYKQLNAINPAPFSCFCRMHDKYIISSSPERYIRRKDNLLLSQPMKGTISRPHESIMQQQNFKHLKYSEKERAENIMITDLVRNDLSRVAMRGSVKVSELCKVYAFPHVFQMITDVTATARVGITFSEVLKSTFPMGSMTGAPKISAMQLIDDAEVFKRGMFSGTVGYITPEQDFDFNVLIRTILYNDSNHYLSFMTGSAITAASMPEQEYQESLLKAEAMLAAVSGKVTV